MAIEDSDIVQQDAAQDAPASENIVQDLKHAPPSDFISACRRVGDDVDTLEFERLRYAGASGIHYEQRKVRFSVAILVARLEQSLNFRLVKIFHLCLQHFYSLKPLYSRTLRLSSR
jgi:hypothetical protein